VLVGARQPARGHDLSSLRILGTAGEPINPEAWRWYNRVIGKGRCAIVDTYWQTERYAVPRARARTRASHLCACACEDVAVSRGCKGPRVAVRWCCSGGVLLTPLPGAIPTKPGSATLPFLGIEPVLLDSAGNVRACVRSTSTRVCVCVRACVCVCECVCV
jgi:acetyl-CoA synthetase